MVDPIYTPERPAWWTDPRPGDTIDTRDGRSREVTGRPDGGVEFRDHYGKTATVSLQSWKAWARVNDASIRHYGT